MIFVLVTKGKHESVDCAMVRVFDTKEAAETFCQKQNDPAKKYWTKAAIVKDNVLYELSGREPAKDEPDFEEEWDSYYQA